MTDEAKALVDAKLYGMGVLKNGKYVPLDDVYLDPRDDLIETQAREIERLREEVARLRDTPSRIWAEARDSEWDEGFNYAVKLFRAALGASHDQ